MHDQESFLIAILGGWDGRAIEGDLNAVIYFADWLQDQERDYEAKLLRRRYAVWCQQREYAPIAASRTAETSRSPLARSSTFLRALRRMMPEEQVEIQLLKSTLFTIDTSFRRYIRERFAKAPSASPVGIDHVRAAMQRVPERDAVWAREEDDVFRTVPDGTQPKAPGTR